MRMRDLFPRAEFIYQQNHPKSENNCLLTSTESRSIEWQAEKLCNNDPYEIYRDITKNPNEILTLESVIKFIEYFKLRWEWVRQTNYSYCYHYDSSINRFCWVLVNEIAATKLVDIHPLKILMPTLNLYNEIEAISLDMLERSFEGLREIEFNNESKKIESQSNFFRPSPVENSIKKLEAKLDYKYKLQLSQFVLSDDDKTIIQIADCISYAREDGILKHTHKLFDNKPVPLTDSECRRVEFHSCYSRQYLREIRKYVLAKTNPCTAGGAINNLIQQMRDSGEKGGRDGTSYQPGTDARFAVKNFYNFLKLLNKEERTKLFDCKLPNGISPRIADSFEVAWLFLLLNFNVVIAEDIGLTQKESEFENKMQTFKNNLGDDKQNQEKISQFQSALYAEIDVLHDKFESLLEEYRKRFAKISTHKSKILCIELLATDMEFILDHHKQILYGICPQDTLQDEAKAINIMLHQNILVARKDVLEKYLLNPYATRFGTDWSYANSRERLQGKIFRGVIRSINKLAQVITSIDAEYHEKFFRELLGKLFLMALFKDVFGLGEFLKLIPTNETREIVFKELGKETLREWISDVASLIALDSYFSKKEFCNFIKNTLGEEHLKFILKDNRISFFEKMSLTRGNYIKNEFPGVFSVSAMHTNSNSLFSKSHNKNSHARDEEQVNSNKKIKLAMRI